MNRVWLAVSAGVWLASAADAGELPTHRMRPGTVCGIPNYPYQVVNTTPNLTTTSASLIRVTAGRAVVPDVIPDSPASGLGAVRTPVVFQLADTRLQLDHCFLSRVAVTVHDDGRYLVNFRADQNPQLQNLRSDLNLQSVRDIASPLKLGERVDTVLQTTQLRRNQFVLHVRGYAMAPVRQELPGLGLGKPALFDIPITPFMVQRGEPYYGKFEGRSDALRRSFELIDRVEVDFTYR